MGSPAGVSSSLLINVFTNQQSIATNQNKTNNFGSSFIIHSLTFNIKYFCLTIASDWWLEIACGRNAQARKSRFPVNGSRTFISMVASRFFRRILQEFKWKYLCASCNKSNAHQARLASWLKENIKGSCRLQSGKWHEAVFVSDNPK